MVGARQAVGDGLRHSVGLLERRDDPEDRRAKTIWLTPEGEALTRRVERVLMELRETLLQGVSDADIAAALRVFQAFDPAASRLPEPAA